MPFPIRSSSYVTTAGTSGNNMTLAWPAGTAVGDMVIVATTNGGVGTLPPTFDWTKLVFADFFNLSFGCWCKIMTSADIAAGSGTWYVGLPLSAGQQIWGVAATNGNCAVRESPSISNGLGAGGSQVVSTSSSVTSSDTAVLFCGIVANVVAGVTPGTSLQIAASSGASGILAYDSSLASGVNTFTFSGGGTHANFQIAVILYSGIPPALAISCGDPPSGVKGSPYSHIFPATGGTAPYTFAIISGSLPPGLSLNAATGAATGTPTATGTFPFTIQVTDSATPTPATASVSCSIIIAGAGPWIIQEITAELIPAVGPINGQGHYRYTVRCVDSAQAGTFQGFWNALGGGNSSGGSANVFGVDGGGGAPAGPPGAQITIAKNGTVVGTESELNLIEGTGITITASDDPTNGKVDATINAHSVGGVLVKTANYTAVTADDGKLISFNSASPVTLLLPATAPSATWFIAVENIGAGVLTISPNGRTLDGGGSITLNQNNGAFVFADGADYWTERGSGGTITSIDMTVPPELTVSGVPSSGPNVSIVIGKSTEAAHTAWMGPLSGSAQPTFRLIDASDVPAVASYQAVAKFTASWTGQTSVTITHRFGTTAVIVQCYDASGNMETPQAVTITSSNVVTLTFGVANTGNAVIIGTSSYSANSIYTTSWTSQTSVTVTHNLSSVRVIVSVYDTGGNEVAPQSITITSSNVVTLTFGVAFSGSVVVATSPALLVQPQSYTTSWVSQTSVVVTHGLGTTDVIVQVFDVSGVEVTPQNINVTSTTVVTLTFGSAFSGSVTVIG